MRRAYVARRRGSLGAVGGDASGRNGSRWTRRDGDPPCVAGDAALAAASHAVRGG